MKYDLYGNRDVMVKTAGGGELGVKLVGEGLGVLGSVGGWAISVFTAATVAAGLGLGWTTAKLTSHGPQDADVLRMGYENERLKNDLGYVAARTRHEHEASKLSRDTRAARILGN